MSVCRIPPHPVLTLDLAKCITCSPVLSFESAGPNPGAKGTWGEEFALGQDSDWSADLHDLLIICSISGINGVGAFFGPGGVAGHAAELALALEWLSSDSGFRNVGTPFRFHRPESGSLTDKIRLELHFPANSLRGTGTVSLQLFIADPGMLEPEEGMMATSPGYRLGQLSEETRIVIDGDGSLFPVERETLGPDSALWELRCSWIDPLQDEFSLAHVALTINTAHADYKLLEDQSIPAWLTPLFRQVLASWITVFVQQLKDDPLAQVRDALLMDDGDAISGSIVDAASYMIRVGDLRIDTPSSLAESAQRWIDGLFGRIEGV